MNYIQQAYKGYGGWWRYAITFLVVMSPFLLNFAIVYYMPEIAELSYQEMANIEDKNVFLFQNLSIFVVLLVFLILFVKYLHQRSIISLITSRPTVDWKRFFFAFFLWMAISVGFMSLGFLGDTSEIVWNFKPVPFFTLLIISVLFIPLQTSFEELMFRGYLMQGLGVLVKNRWFPLIITSVAFGLMHSFNPEVNELGYGIMVFYIGTGFLYGITTLMDEGTEIALGLHAANNIVAALFISSDWMVFNTDALFLDTSEPSLGFETYVPVFVLYPLILLIFAKKFKWNNWRDKLLGNIERPLGEAALIPENEIF
ncbi:CPBP family intramembrane metalloprotease [Flavobacteriaceae bacterium F08102]|nr:CPBP family intramembrane metalloprotease [Flavobacteriaceae bacterium F08102]